MWLWKFCDILRVLCGLCEWFAGRIRRSKLCSLKVVLTIYIHEKIMLFAGVPKNVSCRHVSPKHFLCDHSLESPLDFQPFHDLRFTKLRISSTKYPAEVEGAAHPGGISLKTMSWRTDVTNYASMKLVDDVETVDIRRLLGSGCSRVMHQFITP